MFIRLQHKSAKEWSKAIVATLSLQSIVGRFLYRLAILIQLLTLFQRSLRWIWSAGLRAERNGDGKDESGRGSMRVYASNCFLVSHDASITFNGQMLSHESIGVRLSAMLKYACNAREAF